MKRVLTFGVFDYFHIGHLALLEQAREQGDFLIVAVQKDEAIRKYKPEANVFYSTAQRVRLIESLRPVDRVVTYSDVDKDIQRMDFDVFAVGEDQIHDGFQRAIQWCLGNGKNVVRMHYTQDISSTELKKRIKDLS